MVPLRLSQHGALWFAHVGGEFVSSARTSPAIDSLPAQSRLGYDGQFYLFIADDPAHARDYMHVGPDGDQAGRRYGRVLYSFVARAVAVGRTALIPGAMLAINLAAILGATALLAQWLGRHGSSPWFAALYGLWPGMVFAVFRDLTEPLAYGLVVAALVAFDRRRRWVACALLGLAALGRETVVAFAVVGAIALWLEDRKPGRALAFAAASLVPMLAWRAFVTEWLGTTTLDRTGGRKAFLPFGALHAWWPWDSEHWLVVLTAVLPLLLAAAGALHLLRRRESVPTALLVILNVALFVVFLPRQVLVDFGAAERNMTPALLATLACVPVWRDRRAVIALGLLLSPLWFVVAAAALGVDIGLPTL